MSDDLRTKIMAAFKSQMGLVQVVNGFKTDAGTHIFDWRDHRPEKRPFNLSELPAINLCDSKEVIKPLTSQRHEHTLTVDVWAFCATGTPAAYVRKMLADLYKAVGIDGTWGGIAAWTVATGNDMAVQSEGHLSGFCKLTVEVKYRTEAFNADQQA